MPFVRNQVLGKGSEHDNSPENILINYVKDNWTLTSPPVYDIVTAPYGVMFGLGYFGYGDLVCYCEQTSCDIDSMALGGRLDYVEYYVDLVFTVRDYGLEQMGSTPQDCQAIIDYMEDFFDSNHKGLKSQGFNYIAIKAINHGRRELYGLQVFTETFTICMVHGNLNLE
jgi:hypothetical protein